MAWPRDFPEDLDAGTARRVARSFLVVRMARGSLLLLFLAVALVAVEVKDWPRGVSVALASALLLQAGQMVASWRQYAGSGREAGP